MPEATHVAEVNFAAKAKNREEGLLVTVLSPETGSHVSRKGLVVKVYKDVPRKIWEELRSAPDGEPSDTIWETKLKGQYDEKEIDVSLYELSKMLGPSFLAEMLAPPDMSGN